MSRLGHSLVVAVYLLLAVWDFIPTGFPVRMVFPLLWLTLCASSNRWWLLAASLFFSFMGDVMGWQHQLIPQIGFFALAQITYIIILRRQVPPRDTWTRPIRLIQIAALALVYASAMLWIFPKADDRVVAIGIAVYGILLLGMCHAALSHKNLSVVLGATLFVASDFILGVHLFVSRVPHSVLCIMIPYYLGQLMLYSGIRSLYLTDTKE